VPWSKNLIETTRENIYTGVEVKNLNGAFGTLVVHENGSLTVKIKGDGASPWEPSYTGEEFFYDNTKALIDTGWAVD
jgi:hypothetical protein